MAGYGDEGVLGETGLYQGDWESQRHLGKEDKIVFLSQIRFQGAGGYFIPGPYKCHHANLENDAQNGEVTGI